MPHMVTCAQLQLGTVREHAHGHDGGDITLATGDLETTPMGP